jgi:hypothetical protein
MSSLPVRTEVTDWLNKNYLATPWFDLSFHWDIDEISEDQRAPFMLVQFASPGETLSSLGPDNCWREDGILMFHICGPVGGDNMKLLIIAENMRKAFRGKRLGVTVIESVSPPTNAAGASIKFDGNWVGFTMSSSYTADHEPS